MSKRPDSIVPRGIDRKHRQHVKKFHKPAQGELAHVKGHALTMVSVTTISFKCECGVKLPQGKRR